MAVAKGQAKTLPETSSKSSGWEWNAVRYRAAAQLADGQLKDYEIARKAGISARQFQTWKRDSEFQALVQAIVSDAVSSIRDEVVATKAGRLRVLVDLHNKLLAIIEARAERYANEREWAAGESTGLIVTKETWGKTNSQEAAADLALVKQIQSLHEQIHKEQHGWDTSLSIKHSGRVDHVHRVNRYESLTDEELDQLERVAQKLAIGEVSS